MFVPEKLLKARVVCPKKSTEKVVDALYQFGTIHVTRPKAFSPSKPLESFKEISEQLVKLRAVEKELGLKGEAKAVETDYAGASRLYSSLGLEKLEDLLSEKRRLQGEKEKLEQRLQELAAFKGFKSSPEILARPSQKISVKCFSLQSQDQLKQLKARFSFEYYDGNALVAFDSRDRGIVEEFAKKNNCLEVAIPAVFASSSSFVKAFEEAYGELAELTNRLKENAKETSEFKAKHGTAILQAVAALEAEALKAELPARFAESQMLVVVEGFVPEKMANDLEKRLSEELGNGFFLEKQHSAEGQPTKMDNPRPIRPFEFLVRNLSLPAFDEIDPTFLVFLSFPLFFGMILGDIGYGLAMIAISLFMRKKFKEGFFRAAAGMMILSGLWTIFFGFVFGEFLGMEKVFGFEFHPLIARAEEHGLLLLMQLSILVGFLHVLLGFVVGFASNYRAGHKKHAFAKIAWLVVCLCLVGFLASSSDVELLGLTKQLLSVFPSVIFMYGLFAGLVGLVVLEGINALLELPGLVSNIVSYLRIMAIGVSGVILASMINKIPLSFSLEPVALLSFLLFSLAFIIGHSFALALGIFESSIQSLRLHYVEFFSKFFHGGGIPFMPLRQKRSD